jgi:hypothetical protein
MDPDFRLVAERILAATLGQESWIDKQFDSEEMEYGFYLVVDALQYHDPKAWRTLLETAWFFARHPEAQLANSPGLRRFKESLAYMLEEFGYKFSSS